MNDYIYMISLATGTVLGLSGGIIAALFCLKGADKTKSSRHAKRKDRKPKDSDKLMESRIDESGLLEKRLKTEKNSWTDFTCHADNKDTAGHIRRARKKEDRAYEYLKRKALK